MFKHQAESLTPKLRIDKWLWFARVVKTRSLATKLVQAGNVRLNREKVKSASYGVKVDDVLTIAVHNRVRVLKVVKIGERRGPATEAQSLYEDLSPQPVQTEKADSMLKMPAPEKRPDKRARRQIQNFKNDLF